MILKLSINDFKVKYKNNNPKLITLNNSKVKAIKAGTATVRVYYRDVYTDCKIYIKGLAITVTPDKKKLNIIKEKVINLKNDELVSYRYPETDIRAEITGNSSKKVKWSASPSGKVSLISKGNTVSVKAKKTGNVKIIAKYRDVEEKCVLSIKEKEKTAYLFDHKSSKYSPDQIGRAHV